MITIRDIHAKQFQLLKKLKSFLKLLYNSVCVTMPVVTPWMVEVRKILDKPLPAGAKLKEIKPVLLSHGKAYTQRLNVDVVLPHPKNRSGRILVAGDAHTKGLRMVNVSADIDLVSGSVAWEIPEEPEKSTILAKLHQLVDGADGLLAPITGNERVLSTDASHTTAFVKAVKHGCKTNVPELADRNGMLLPASSFKGDLVRMCEEGWEWFIISRDVASAFPTLVELFQRGLNLKHAAVTRAHEIEVARSLVELSENMTLNQAQEELRLNQPVCVDYISKVAAYVERYSGEGELINYLDELTKAIGCASAQLGQEFMTALVDLKVKSTSTTLPFIRLACWLAQVSNPKVVDGIAKHLSPSLLSKFKKDDDLADVEALELLLKQGWELGPAVSKDPVTNNFTGPARLAFGKFAVRCVLHFLGAEKDSREPNGFKDLVEINRLYYEGLTVSVDTTSTVCDAATKKRPRGGLSSLATTANPKDILLNEHQFLRDFTHFTCKEYGSKIFVIKEITDATIIFAHKPLFGDEEVQEVEYKLVKHWRGIKDASSPVACDESLWTPCLPENHTALHKEVLKAKATLAMQEGYNSHSAKTGYGCALSPIGVFIKDGELKFNKGEFKLVAYGALKELDPKKSEKVDDAMLVSNKTQAAKFVVSAPKKLPKKSDDKFIVSPFFIVGTTTEPSEANMKLSHVIQDGWSIPMLVNTRQVKSTDMLLILLEQDDAKGLDVGRAIKRGKTS